MSTGIYDLDDGTAVAKLFAKMFISRSDVKAYQRPDGSWYPDRTPINMQDMLAHLSGARTMGHYLIGPNDTCKFMAFDIDLEEAKPEHQIYWPMPGDWEYPQEKIGWTSWYPGDPRGTWMNTEKLAPLEARFLVFQMRSAAHMLARSAEDLLGLRTAVAYSGSKGLHVYAFFDEPVPAALAREMAELTVDAAGGFAILRGKNFFKKQPKDDDPVTDMQQLSVEIYPKQDSLADKDKKLGNLLRLPLGRNLKGNGRPAPMFLDVRHRMTEFKSRNPIEALTVADQWAGVMTE